MTPEQALEILRKILSHDSFAANWKTFDAISKALRVLEGAVKRVDEDAEEAP